MKKKLITFFIVILFLMIKIGICQTPTMSPQLWTKSTDLSDDFNSYDGLKWTHYEQNGYGAGGENYPIPINILMNPNDLSHLTYTYDSSLSSNVLNINTKKEPSTLMFDNLAYDYATGQIVTNKKYMYGYFETRCKIPQTNQIVGQAFWLWNQIDERSTCTNPEWPKIYTEIDVFETRSPDPWILPWNIHQWSTWTPLNTCCNANQCWDYNLNPESLPNIVDFSSSYHKIGIDWQPDHIDWYVDDILWLHVKDGDLKESDCHVEPNQLNIRDYSFPLKVVFCGMLTSSFQGNPLPDTSDHLFKIDYFNYYKKNPEIKIGTVNLSTNSVQLIANTNISGDTYEWRDATDNFLSTGNSYTRIYTTNSNYTFSKVIANQHVCCSTSNDIVPDYNVQSEISVYQSYGGNGIILNTNISSPKNLIYASSTVKSGTNFGYDKNVVIKAKDKIQLNSGFKIGLGSTFYASLDNIQ